MEKEKLTKFKKHFKDFEIILNSVNNPVDALIFWLKSWRPVDLFEIVKDWIDTELPVQEIRKRLQELYHLIDFW